MNLVPKCAANVFRIRNLIATAMIAYVATCTQASAAMLMTLEGELDSPLVTVTFSGRATVDYEYQFGFLGMAWAFEPTTFDPFPAAITGTYPIVSGSASFRTANVVFPFEHPISGVFFQDSSNSTTVGFERFGVNTLNPNGFALGSTIEWYGQVQIDLSSHGLTFGDLRSGTSEEVYANNFPRALGQLTVAAIPEPSISGFFLAGLVVLLISRRFTFFGNFGAFCAFNRLEQHSESECVTGA